jgi:hypothetical protein
MRNLFQFVIGIALMLGNSALRGQNMPSQINPLRIPTPVFPILLIGNDIQTASVGDACVGHSHLNNTGNDNVAKILFNKSDWTTSLNHSKYMASIIPDMSITSLSSNYRLQTNKVVGLELNYFRTGLLKNTDANSNLITKAVSGEWNVAGKLAMRVGLNSSLGVGIRYMYSSAFSSATSSNNVGFETNSQVLANIAYFYHGQLSHKYYNRDKRIHQRLNSQGEGYNTWGISISNIGGAIKTANSNIVNYMPTVLKVGYARNYFLQDENKLSASVQFSKLLVPTPPIRDVNGNVIKGTDDANLDSFNAMFLSLYDAPDGFSEKLKEVQVNFGLEYSIKESFYVGAGFSYENKAKGNRNYLSVGLGGKYKSIDFNFSYWFPMSENNALGNSLRSGLVFNQ